MKVLSFLICVLVACPLAAQTPRQPVLAGNPVGPAVNLSADTFGELSAIVFKDDALQSISLITSDGRGLNWTPPLRVDQGTAYNKTVFPDSVRVVQDNVYVYWMDHRLPDDTVYFNRSLDGGLTFLPTDVKLDPGLLLNDVLSVKMVVDPMVLEDPEDDLVVFLMAVLRESTGRAEILLNYSLDSGANFLGMALPLSLHNGFADVDFIDLAVEGGLIYGVWQDNYQDLLGDTDNVWMSKFDPFLGIFLFEDLLINPLNAPITDVEDELIVEALGDLVAVFWQPSPLLGGPEELWANVSPDGGLSWSGEQIVGGYVPGLHDVDLPDAAITPTCSILVVWEDNRSGLDQAYTSRSMDQGLTWQPDFQLSNTYGEGPRIISRETTVVATWCAGPFPNTCEARWSKNDCFSWGPITPVSQNLGDVDFPALTFNAKYTNFIMAWGADDRGQNDVYVGGFRRQTFTPFGSLYFPGTPIHFEVSNWPEPDHGWPFVVLFSARPADFFLANGLNLGLRWDRFTNISLNMGLSGLLRGQIDATGWGTTPVMAAPTRLPAKPLYAAAVAFQDLLRVGRVTDFRLIE